MRIRKKYIIHRLPGWKGVLQTVQIIDKLSRDGAIIVKEKASMLVKDRKDFIGKINAIFKYLRGRIKYVRDIYGMETLHSVPTIEKLGYGDCDDFTVIGAAYLRAVGYPVKYVVSAVKGMNPNHIYLRIRNINFDLTQKALGLRPKKEKYRRILKVA